MTSGPKISRIVGVPFRVLASLRLTLALVLLLAAALACAFYLESTRGREYAQWHFQGSAWFFAILGALAANIAAAALARFPRRWSGAGFVIAPVGLLVLLAGFVFTLTRGIEGRVILWGGGAADSATLTHHSLLSLLAPLGKGVQSTELSFSPGPADWPAGETLDFGEVDGMGVRVLQFYRHARHQMDWVPDETGRGGPAIQVAVSDRQSGASAQSWCVPILFGRPIVVGGTNVSFEQAPVPLLRDDFLKPPAMKPGSRGVLSMHYKDRVYSVPVDDNVGKKVPVGDSGLTVEIVAYHANAKLVDKDKFSSEGTEPKNPMLQLQVHAPGQKQPVAEIAYAYANKPFVNRDTIKKQNCPVKFWYHHPAAVVTPGAEFIQTPDGKLHCRVGVDGAYQPRGEVKPGEPIKISANLEISLLGHVLHGRQEESFVPVEAPRDDLTAAEAAALIELTVGGKTEQFWLARNDTQRGVRKTETSRGPLIVMFGYERHRLGASLKLLDIRRDADPDDATRATYASRVQLTDEARAVDFEQEISADQPLQYREYTFSPAGFVELQGGIKLSFLRVTSDPGRLVKYSGAAILGLGILLAICAGVFRRRAIPSHAVKSQAADPTKPADVNAVIA